MSKFLLTTKVPIAEESVEETKEGLESLQETCKNAAV